ncbi:hypothetical protein E2P81_ATG09771 [Venturia nashicola]|uniref:Phosphoglycerate mutase family protein n=1 Tax=Venturia nashicola TaxID=86259 RepID=A0A4Z1NEM2_9PEZI|nr:hypothetical protein E6O75_ATG09987 [Venturia nashicola]TLD14781.1 hypothetical protein E2P81_ATG09771 [Venturia nashicola]
MVQPPSTIIVVRHGARLDASDKNWHLTSPAPYDPPLTYGGWNQSKALGARIAGILHDRAIAPIGDGQTSGTCNGTGPNGQFKKKQKVVIHSSPFLRCLQTSVAIGSGIAQYSDASYLRKPKTSDKGLKTNSASIPELEEDEYSVKALDDNSSELGSIKTVMRVDAFLGEWLTPGYFDHITPPPNSTMMVASAKSHLLRREQLEVFRPSLAASGQFPGGWKPIVNRQVSAAVSSAIDDSIPEAEVEYHHHRASSQSVTRRDSSRDHRGLNPLPPLPSRLRPTDKNYVPPIPAYSIRPSDPIPRGYCVHARDACTDIDLHWDSMRSPQDWGDGGELGEEWSAMHKRFRNGLYKMNAWYKEHLPEFHPEKEDPMALNHDDGHDYAHEDHDDEEYELVLLIVTHAAGCNALMGALTNQPVLMDFGLTSLSMAVRKQVVPQQDEDINGDGTSPLARRRSSVDFGLAEEYEVKVMASANHLRAGPEATIAQGAHLQSPHLVPQIPEYKQRNTMSTGRTLGAALNGEFNGDTRRSMNSSLGSMRRSSLVPTPAQSSRTNTGNPAISGSSSGLWSKNTTVASLDGMQELDLGSPAQTRPASSCSDRSAFPAFSTVEYAPQQQIDKDVGTSTTAPSGLVRTFSQNAGNAGQGLWGAKTASTTKESINMRAKRRWTLHEEEDGHYLE